MQDYSTLTNLDTYKVASNKLPFQLLPLAKKDKNWLKEHADFFYSEAKKQAIRNSVFSDIRKMTQGEYTYRAVDIEQTLLNTSLEADYKKLTDDVSVSTHLKHFDFLGIIANAIIATFGNLDDLYRIESTDEYTDNEYIRQRTQKFEERLQAVLKLEVNKMLMEKGINPNQENFKSQEEQQQYVQMLEAETQKLTPEKIEEELQKNFKVIAIDWANNVITTDKKKFGLDREDKRALLDYILTGRWFRHFKIGYDYYDIEYWRPEDVFFEQTADIEYPQDAGYVGRLSQMSLSDTLATYGHLMTTTQQEKVGNFWGQDTKSKGGSDPTISSYVVPFENYFDHQRNVQMEDALGAPLAQTKNEDGTVTRHWMPRADAGGIGNPSNILKNTRTDIKVSNDLIDVLQVYWTSYKRIAILIYRNEVGALTIKTTTEELVKEFIVENNIKVKRDLDLEELQTALRENRLEEYEGSLVYQYLPEEWQMVVIKAGSSIIIKDDIILGGKPLLQQIKGDSNLFHVRKPVVGLISKSPITKAFPFQQMHNICMNQNTELLADEIGVFYTFDLNALETEVTDKGTTEALYSTLDTIRTTKLLPVNLSRTNTQGSPTYPNVFQKNEIVFREQVIYRKEMAEYYRQQGFQQLGITPQMLGEPTKYTTAEGVNVQKTASYALMSNLIDEFNSSKFRALEIHVAVAQMCEVNGKVSNRRAKNSDGANSFIDILAEDPDYFALRNLNILPASNSRERAVVEAIKGMLLSDNTIQKDFGDIVDIMSNPNVLEIKQVAKTIRLRNEKAEEAKRNFESEQLDKQIKARKEETEDLQAHQKEIEHIRGEYSVKQSYLTALGRDSASTPVNEFEQTTQAYKLALSEEKINSDTDIKNREITRKENVDLNAKEKSKQDFLLKTQEFNLRKQISENNKSIAIINPQ